MILAVPFGVKVFLALWLGEERNNMGAEWAVIVSATPSSCCDWLAAPRARDAIQEGKK